MERTLPSASRLDLSAVGIGRTWFRWRGFSPVPLLVLCLGLPAQAISNWVMALVFFGIGLAEAGRIWAVGYAGSATRTRGDTVGGLVYAGPFRYVRNPLYLANILMYGLAAVAFGLGWWSGLVVLYFAVQYHFIVAYEEDRLRAEHETAYTYYCARVSRWVPSLKPAVESSAHHFDFLKAFRSERATLVALVVLIGLAVSKQQGLLVL